MESMHIECTNCRKIFEIKENLIPKNGRLLQCGNCDHKWFYQKEKKEVKDVEVEELKKEKIELIPREIPKEVSTFKNEKKSINLFKLFLVIIISFVALIILVDTFKFQIKKYLPGIEIILNNLYQSLLDVALFFKDLIN